VADDIALGLTSADAPARARARAFGGCGSAIPANSKPEPSKSCPPRLESVPAFVGLRLTDSERHSGLRRRSADRPRTIAEALR